jgi:hypothetical protein
MRMLTVHLGEGLVVLVHDELRVIPRRRLGDIVLAALLNVDDCHIRSIIESSNRGELGEGAIVQQGHLSLYLFD